MESSAVLSIPDSLEDEAGNSPELFGSNSSSESSSEASSDESEMELGHETFQSSLITSSYKKLVLAKRTPGDASADQPADGTPEDTSQAIRGYRFVSMTQPADLCATFLCPECSCDALTLEEKCEHRMGLSSWLEVVCRVCSHRVSFTTSQQIGSIMDVNRRSVLAAREIGCGRARLATFCCMMDMPPPVAAVSYGKHVKSVYQSVKKRCSESMHKAQQLVKRLEKDLGQTEEIVNTSVSCDATWQQRGFTSVSSLLYLNSQDKYRTMNSSARLAHLVDCMHLMILLVANFRCSGRGISIFVRPTTPGLHQQWKLTVLLLFGNGHSNTSSATSPLLEMETASLSKVLLKLTLMDLNTRLRKVTV